MIIYLANDHAATPLKNAISRHLTLAGHVVHNLGVNTTDSVDYPDFAHAVCREVTPHPDSIGILLCGSGVGMSMAANRHANIRAALCHTPQIATLARQHNNANVLCLGARVVCEATNIAITNAFIAAEFEGGRHAQRLEKL